MIRCYAALMIAMLVASLIHPAHATPKAERDAEARRLSVEIERLGQKTAWPGVERNYKKLNELKNVSVASGVHLLAAHAALSRGDIRKAWERSQRATARAVTTREIEEAATWIADFWVNYGEVELELSVAFSATPHIEARDGGGFSPKTRLAMTHAGKELAATRTFTGFLPMGRYHIGDTDFDVVGGPKVKVFVKDPKTRASTPAPAPIPTADSPDQRLVLGVRGGGWNANDWRRHAASVSSALRAVDGITDVSVFGPTDPWLVVQLDPDRLAEHNMSVDDVAGALTLGLDLTDLVIRLEDLVIPPGRVEPDVLMAAAMGWTEEAPLRLSDLATLELANPGSVAVPVDTSVRPNYRFEVTIAPAGPTPEEVAKTARSVEGAALLGLKLEGPPTR